MAHTEGSNDPSFARIHEISNFVNGAEFLQAAAGDRTFDFPVMKMRSKAGQRITWSRVMVFRTVALLYVLMIASSLLLSWLVSTGRM